MSAELNLLPCAHCGSTDVQFSSPGGEDEKSYDFVICNGCGLSAARADCGGDPREAWNRRAAPSASASDELPPLPEYVGISEMEAERARKYAGEYARAAIAADRARQGEPDAYMVVLSGVEPVALNFQRVHAEAKLREWEGAGEVVPLYRAATKAAAPADAPSDPLDWPIPCDLVDGHVTMRKGIRLRAVLARMQYLSALCKGNLQKAYQYDVEHANDGLNGAPAEDAREQQPDELPEELFDGHAVYSEITRHLGKSHCHNHETVSATLDAVVRLIRCRAAGSEKAQAGWKLVPEEITIEMAVAAFGRESVTHLPGRDFVDDEAKRFWRELLDAAPSHPPEAQAGEDAFCDAHCVWTDHHPGCMRATPSPAAQKEGGEPADRSARASSR